MDRALRKAAALCLIALVVWPLAASRGTLDRHVRARVAAAAAPILTRGNTDRRPQVDSATLRFAPIFDRTVRSGAADTLAEAKTSRTHAPGISLAAGRDPYQVIARRWAGFRLLRI